MKIIVTGASGFIGRNFLLHIPAGIEVTALYNNDNTFLDFIKKNKIDARAVKCDLRDEKEVKKALAKSNRFDACLYLAGNTDPTFSASNPKEDLEINVFGLLNFLANISCDKFIFFSSGAVYHRLKGDVSPDSRLDPRLPYAISKLAAEQYIKVFTEKGNIGRFIIVRFFGAYGPYEPERKITTRLIKSLALKGEDSYSIYGDGTNYIDLMHIDDAIEGIKQMLKSDANNVVVDFGTGKPMTIQSLVVKIASILGKEIEIKKQGISSEEIHFKMNNARFSKLFDFDFKVSLEEGIQRLKQHLLKQN